jgi:HD superfamily phosphohydrolase
MHLASRFLLGLLRNAEPELRARLEREFATAVREADPDVVLSAETIAELQRQGLIASTAVDPGAAAATVVVDQALRLAALFHDLGHLPFSHDFEYVIQTLVNKRPRRRHCSDGWVGASRHTSRSVTRWSGCSSAPCITRLWLLPCGTW